MNTDKTLKFTMIAGFIFTSILGTLWHFIYEWTGNNPVVGFVAPINESTFEHMKLLVFPTILFMPIAAYFLKKDYPHILKSMSFGILAGTLLLPLLFYAYSGILGFNIAAVDILLFFICTFIIFFITYRTLKNNMHICDYAVWLLIILVFAMIILTYNHPDLGIFKAPLS